MGYQALLFCPDEKTARTVTQVLSELDFEVVPCTEPFAAVKKLMGEHFDAVVVDCDNEQNATLLFKSARNSPNNQSALAVAVVEGQAGVAKAFRIGANLVLTKPINVEQAKGTLRVARGLLRKNEGAKPAAPTSTSKPTSPAPSSPKPTLVPSAAVSRPAPIVNPISPASAPAQKAAPQPSFAASASSAVAAPGESKESVGAVLEQTTSPSITPVAASEANSKVPSVRKEIPLSSNATLPASSAGAASAAAPAREAANIAVPETSSTPEPEVETSTGKGTAAAESSSSSEIISPAPSFTFGGAVESGTQSTSGGSKKALFALVAVALIAAAAYVGWTQFSRPNGTANISAQISAKPAPPAVSQVTPSTTSIAPVTDQSVATSTSDSSVSTHSAGSVKPSATPQTGVDASSAKDRKTSAVDSSRSSAAIVAENKTSVTTPAPQPIIVKTNTAEPTVGKSSVSDAPAPSLNGIASAGSGGTLPNLLGNANSSPAPVLQTLNVSQGVSQGLAIKKTSPAYPANALRMGIEGSVQLLATISKKGDISAVKVLSGDPSLARAAVDAVKQWKYKPYLLDGVPVEIQTQVTVNFKLPR
jgi:TonB family protein